MIIMALLMRHNSEDAGDDACITGALPRRVIRFDEIAGHYDR